MKESCFEEVRPWAEEHRIHAEWAAGSHQGLHNQSEQVVRSHLEAGRCYCPEADRRLSGACTAGLVIQLTEEPGSGRCCCRGWPLSEREPEPALTGEGDSPWRAGSWTKCGSTTLVLWR